MIERPSFGLMREGPSETDGVEREEELAQRDMQERGRRLAAFKKATEGRTWWYGRNGEAYLISDQCVAAGMKPRRVALAQNPEKMLAKLLKRRGHRAAPAVTSP